jgi:hypothetical protein
VYVVCKPFSVKKCSYSKRQVHKFPRVRLQNIPVLCTMWVRIRIGSRFNGDHGSESKRAKMTHKNRKVLNVLFFGLKASPVAGRPFLWRPRDK